MKRMFLLITILALFGFAAVSMGSCGSVEEVSIGGGGGVADDDDDTDIPDDIGCQDGVEFVYDCGYYLINDGFAQAQDEALTECIALGEISQAWICRLNCMSGTQDCDTLYQCLNLCPSTPDTEAT